VSGDSTSTGADHEIDSNYQDVERGCGVRRGGRHVVRAGEGRNRLAVVRISASDADLPAGGTGVSTGSPRARSFAAAAHSRIASRPRPNAELQQLLVRPQGLYCRAVILIVE
jgi:hypothetical protein